MSATEEATEQKKPEPEVTLDKNTLRQLSESEKSIFDTPVKDAIQSNPELVTVFAMNELAKKWTRESFRDPRIASEQLLKIQSALMEKINGQDLKQISIRETTNQQELNQNQQQELTR